MLRSTGKVYWDLMMLTVTGTDCMIGCMKGMLAEAVRAFFREGHGSLHRPPSEAQQHELESSCQAAKDPMNIA